MIQPWENPRSKFYWFRRRVPSAYRKFGLPAEIKFSLETTDWDKNSPPPNLPDEIVVRTREKYIEAYERLTGRQFAWR
jgi:phosphoribosylaminoimidazole-succinocarboxamide synthase